MNRSVHALERWIGMAHVRPLSDPDLLDGGAGAYVSVVALASSLGEFVARASAGLEELGFEVLEWDDIEPWAARLANGTPAPEIVALADGLSVDGWIAVSTFDAYDVNWPQDSSSVTGLPRLSHREK